MAKFALRVKVSNPRVSYGVYIRGFYFEMESGFRNKRNDNSSIAEHVHSINSATSERRLNSFIERNVDGLS